MNSAVAYVCQAPTGVFLSDSTKAELLTEYWHDILDVWVLSLDSKLYLDSEQIEMFLFD